MKNALLPERHPTKDFFVPDIFDAIPLKNDRHTMEHPFFTLSTKPDVRTINYQHNGVNVSLSPHNTHGLPTMMDKDILLYLGSLVMEEINKGNIPPRKLRFSAHDLMVATNRHTNDVGYAMLKKAFERLTGCLIVTNIKTNNRTASDAFHLLERFKILETSHDKRRMVKLEATLSEWFYNALLGGEVLTINRHYFRLRKPLERRLYELARKHCGKQKEWFIGIESLHQKCGSLSPLKKFRFQVRQITELNNTTQHFPDYDLELRDNDTVRFTLKRAFKGAIAKEKTKATGKISPISLEATERARDIVKYSNMGWDYYALEAEFNYSLQQGFRPESVDGAFIAFIKKKVEKRA